MVRPLRILWVATKPPWPPADGGRLVAAGSIEALVAAGHTITVVAPALRPRYSLAPPGVGLQLVPARPLPLPLALLSSLIRRVPVSIARHSRPAVRREVARLLASQSFDVVHAEQAQALPQTGPAQGSGHPVVFRAQNVESDLWTGAGMGGFSGLAARREGARLARWEGEAVGRLFATVALTEADAVRLETLASGQRRVYVVPAPFANELPGAERALPGDPAVVLLGSSGWLPNRRGAEAFRAEAWPAIHRALPRARLHVFGSGGEAVPEPGIESHPAPDDSRTAFPPGAVLVVPLALASGVRMKILEAWARGVAVVATPAAAAGLEAQGGRELLLAQGAEGFVAALRRLHDEPGLGPALTASGRALLRRRHDPATVAAALAAIYALASGTKKKS
jgi:polysaccharide biosynthesis protein PslH